MGLTIHFDLRFSAYGDTGAALDRLHRLRERARRRPFDFVMPIRSFPGAECCGGVAPAFADPYAFIRLFSAQFIEDPDDPDDIIPVYPEELHGFLIGVGRRCEGLALGLAAYPERMPYRGRVIEPDLPGWRWRAFCKTQYTSLYGEKYFLRCHREVIGVLDDARDIGFEVDVRDDGGYWEHRDEARLLHEVHRMNGMIAAMAGRIADSLQRYGRTAQSPIFEHPRFEDLEMQGRET